MAASWLRSGAELILRRPHAVLRLARPDQGHRLRLETHSLRAASTPSHAVLIHQPRLLPFCFAPCDALLSPLDWLHQGSAGVNTLLTVFRIWGKRQDMLNHVENKNETTVKNLWTRRRSPNPNSLRRVRRRPHSIAWGVRRVKV